MLNLKMKYLGIFIFFILSFSPVNAKDLTGSRTNPFAFQEGLRNLGLIR